MISLFGKSRRARRARRHYMNGYRAKARVYNHGSWIL